MQKPNRYPSAKEVSRRKSYQKRSMDRFFYAVDKETETKRKQRARESKLKKVIPSKEAKAKSMFLINKPSFKDVNELFEYVSEQTGFTVEEVKKLTKELNESLEGIGHES